MNIKSIFHIAILFLYMNLSIASQCVESEVGRYKIYFNPQTGLLMYLLDTKTGRIWRNTIVSEVEGSPTVWLPEIRIDSEKHLKNWLESQNLIEEN